MQADLPQRLPVTPRTDNPQQTKDRNRKNHLQAPKEALDASPYNRQSTAQDKIYIVVQPMPAPGTVRTPYFIGQDVLEFINGTSGYVLIPRNEYREAPGPSGVLRLLDRDIDLKSA
jgi:hypothetical protein